ncbi:MAG: hypothetical protein MUF18_21415, partial [Fimbriiglobus sp.]|nr:hypothetical protein [Fimbriiglobus sp.]
MSVTLGVACAADKPNPDIYVEFDLSTLKPTTDEFDVTYSLTTSDAAIVYTNTVSTSGFFRPSTMAGYLKGRFEKQGYSAEVVDDVKVRVYQYEKGGDAHWQILTAGTVAPST